LHFLYFGSFWVIDKLLSQSFVLCGVIFVLVSLATINNRLIFLPYILCLPIFFMSMSLSGNCLSALAVVAMVIIFRIAWKNVHNVHCIYVIINYQSQRYILRKSESEKYSIILRAYNKLFYIKVINANQKVSSNKMSCDSFSILNLKIKVHYR
jgi:hypothetical protein